jgi:hypothetical protein
MGWISIVLTIVSNLPEIIKLVSSIISLIRKIKNGKEAKREIKSLSLNVKKAKEKKDYSGLEMQLSRLKGDLGE